MKLLFESILNVQDPSWDSELQAQGGKWSRREFRIVNQPGYPLALDVYGGEDLLVKAVYSNGSGDASARGGSQRGRHFGPR